MTETIDNHVQAILEGRPLTGAGLEWLQGGFLDHIETGKPLQKCLELKRRNFLITTRDYHLIRALAQINPVYSNRRKIAVLQDEINMFFKIWPGCKDLDNPNPRWSRLWQEIFLALRCRVGIPDTRMIEKIAKSNDQSIS